MNTFLGNFYAKVATTTAATILLFCVLGYSQHAFQEVPGILDARQWDFAHERLTLNGHWSFYDQQLLTPAECNHTPATYASVPGLWNDLHASGSGLGYATYSLKVLLPDTITTLSLQLPQLYNSYQVWIDGRMLGGNGTVGTIRQQVTPQWRPQIITFSGARDTVHIVLQLANFHHHKGGIREPLYLGATPIISKHHAIAYGSVLTEAMLLLLEAIVFLILYFTQKNMKVTLFFALLCLAWCVRALFSNLYPFIVLFPNFNWTATVKIEYMTLYAIMILSALFLNKLFPDVSSRIFLYLLIIVNALFVLFTLFTEPLMFTRWLSLYLMAAGITLAYAFFVVVRALILEKTGVWFLVLSLILGVILMGYDILSYEKTFLNNSLVSSVGYIIIFLSVAVGLLLHLGIIKSKMYTSTTLTYKDLYQKDGLRNDK